MSKKNYIKEFSALNKTELIWKLVDIQKKNDTLNEEVELLKKSVIFNAID